MRDHGHVQIRRLLIASWLLLHRLRAQPIDWHAHGSAHGTPEKPWPQA
jgi:hypothetical protein